MEEDELSGSETEENGSDSSSEELDEAPTSARPAKMSEYEKQRMKRIKENEARMEAMGLRKMANSFAGSVKKNMTRSEAKGKRKLVEEDEEYRPSEGEEDEKLNSSGEGDDLVDSDDPDKSASSRKKKTKKRSSTPKKRKPLQKKLGNSDAVVDDDDALMKAIALSLQDSAGFLDTGKSSCRSGVLKVSARSGVGGGKNTEEGAGQRKSKKWIGSRLQMTEDELVLHYFQIDERDKGGITLGDVKRVSEAHDFTWTDDEMTDMISCFDSDGDGKLSLDDFRKMVIQCNMLQASENV